MPGLAGAQVGVGVGAIVGGGVPLRVTSTEAPELVAAATLKPTPAVVSKNVCPTSSAGCGQGKIAGGFMSSNSLLLLSESVAVWTITPLTMLLCWG